MENSLPNGWVECGLGEIAEIIMGQSPPSNSYNDKAKGLPFFQGKSEFTSLHPVVRKWCNAPLKIAKQNDVLLSVRAPVGAVNIADQECCIGRGLTALRFKYKSDNKFLFYLMQNYEEELSSQSTGSTFEAVSKKVVEELIISIPPLAEQHRIVAKLDALLARIANCKNRLEKIPALLKNFRQSVLAAAVSGELTKEWREQRETFIDGVFGLELPNSWKICRFERIIKEGPQNGMYKPQSAYGAGKMILRIDNFYDGVVNPWNTLKRLLLTKEELKTYKLENNDIVVNRVNSMPYLGKSALIRNLNEDCVFESNMMRIKVDNSSALPEYIIRYLNSIFGISELRKNAKHAVNQSSINQQDVKAVTIILPPLEEQKEIVDRIEKLFHFADSIEARYQKAKVWFDKIPQAILVKAFSGELVEQDENDEPASVLLERIKKEKTTLRQAQGDKKQTNKTKPTAKRKKVYEENEGLSLAAED